jgi:hypothetical protein
MQDPTFRTSPHTLTALPTRSSVRIENELAHEVYVSKDKESTPARPKPLTDKLEPKTAVFKIDVRHCIAPQDLLLTDRLDPNVTVSNMDTWSFARASPRTEMELPIDTTFKTDTSWLRLKIPVDEIDDPTRRKERIDSTDPRVVNPKADTRNEVDGPPRKLTDEPRCKNDTALTCVPCRATFLRDNADPMHSQLLME